jgi:hypothetical protein
MQAHLLPGDSRGRWAGRVKRGVPLLLICFSYATRKETNMEKAQLLKEAEAYVDASQRVKAVKDVLAEKRDQIVPLFKKFVKPDENGNRTLEFGDAKISLVPQRKVDEEALKALLGPEATRFTTRLLVVSTHLIRQQEGAAIAAEAEEVVKNALRGFLEVERLPRRAVTTVTEFDTEAALASLPKEKRRDVKEVVTYTLRPYPEKKGFAQKVKAAWAWLSGK